jgi:hypothetical protein
MVFTASIAKITFECAEGANAVAWRSLLRLGILPVGYICPKELRALRDLMRKRSQFVRQRTAQIRSIQKQMARTLGSSLTGNAIKRWRDCDVDARVRAMRDVATSTSLGPSSKLHTSRFGMTVTRSCERKCSKPLAVVAIKAVAHRCAVVGAV